MILKVMIFLVLKKLKQSIFFLTIEKIKSSFCHHSSVNLDKYFYFAKISWKNVDSSFFFNLFLLTTNYHATKNISCTTIMHKIYFVKKFCLQNIFCAWYFEIKILLNAQIQIKLPSFPHLTSSEIFLKYFLVCLQFRF